MFFLHACCLNFARSSLQSFELVLVLCPQLLVVSYSIQIGWLTKVSVSVVGLNHQLTIFAKPSFREKKDVNRSHLKLKRRAVFCLDLILVFVAFCCFCCFFLLSLLLLLLLLLFLNLLVLLLSFLVLWLFSSSSSL